MTTLSQLDSTIKTTLSTLLFVDTAVGNDVPRARLKGCVYRPTSTKGRRCNRSHTQAIAEREGRIPSQAVAVGLALCDGPRRHEALRLGDGASPLGLGASGFAGLALGLAIGVTAGALSDDLGANLGPVRSLNIAAACASVTMLASVICFALAAEVMRAEENTSA